jgi:Kdo2-lipid IVA lauroyltransferase/acyltransferase
VARHPTRDRVVARFLRLLARLLAPLSLTGVQRFGRGLGRTIWRLSRRDRGRALGHLAIAFPERSLEERTKMARGCFLHQGVNLAECLWLLTHRPEHVRPLIEVHGLDAVELLRKTGRPMVILTGHCGNWELLACVLNLVGLPVKAIGREMDSSQLNDLLVEIRSRFGTETIQRGGSAAARQLLAAMRGGGVVGMLIDQDTDVEGVWVPFFGKLANTPVAAARMALKMNAVVVPTFIERLEDGRHRVTFQPMAELPPDEKAATALMTAAIEAQIRRRPEQWVWWHKRWRRQPPAEPA